MKNSIFIFIVFVFFFETISSQNFVESINKYYKESTDNKEDFISEWVTNEEKELDSISKLHNWDKNIVFGSSVFLTDFDNSIVMLLTSICNTADYTFEKDIYNYLCLNNPYPIGIAFLKENETCMYLINNSLGEVDDILLPTRKKKKKKIPKAIPEILKRNPDAIFKCSPLSIRYSVTLYTKDNLIYAFRDAYGDTYELNEYIKKFYTEKEIISFSNRKTHYIEGSIIGWN